MKRSLTALAAVLLLCLSGCGQGADPPAQADPTPSVSTTTPSGPAEPVMPSAAKQQTKAGAIAFARYYWQAVDYAQRSLDTAQLVALQTSGCAACDGGRHWIEKIARAGGTIHGGLHRITAAEAHGTPSTGFVVFLRQTTSPQSVKGAAALDKRYPGGTDHVVMRTVWESGWQVASWDTTD